MPGERQRCMWIALSLWAAAVAGAALYGAWHGFGGRAFAVAIGVFAFFLGVQVLFAAGNMGERIARGTGPQLGVLIGTIPFFAYLIYLLGTNSFTWWRVAISAAYILAPVAIASSAGAARPGALQDYLAMLAIFLPLKLRWLNGFWPYPGARIGYVATALLAVSVALATFLFVRQFDGVGYNIVLDGDTAFQIVLHFGLLALILIPLGTVLHFIRFDPAAAHWKSLPLDALGIFFLTAWPEELLFRGLLQNSFARTFSSQFGGWIAASVVFGLAHINNNGVFPNWRYALLATIAGIFYGRTWRKTGSIIPAAIVHALVDTTWHLLFRTL